MALTDGERISVFEILGVPYDSSVDIIDSNMGLTAITYESLSIDFQTQLKINQRINSLSSTEEEKLLGYIAAWENLGTQTGILESGSMGGISGATSDPAAERRLIKDRVITLIPVVRYKEELQGTASGCSSNINGIR